MPLRAAFVGFQTGHAMSLYADLKANPNIEIVATCEEDPAARQKAESQSIALTHSDYAAMLRDVPCDIVACSDWYGIRGARMIQAMEAGRHVIADKPICTRLSEVERMKELAHAKHLKVGCQLPLPYAPSLIAARNSIHAGAIGDVHSVTFNGAHSFNYTGRPVWMFEPERYGGSLNDIAIHGIDTLPWLTGRTLTGVTAAREWNARVPEHPTFRDGSVVLFKLDNGGAAYGDVSWLSPDKAGYRIPYYWRFTILGTTGALEAGFQSDNVQLFETGATAATVIPGADVGGHTYVSDFLLDIANTPAMDRLHTERVLESSRVTLVAQDAANTNARDVAL